MHASNGIMFNHESPIRGETFVTRKITRAVARIEVGLEDTLWIGNLEAERDWGHAREYVEVMWKIVQQPKPDDYVIATGKKHSVREFIEAAFAEVDRKIVWEGNGANEIGRDAKTKKLLVKVDPRFFRPTEVDLLLGDATKAREKLGWKPTVGMMELVREMVEADLSEARIELEIAAKRNKRAANSSHSS
jgi:GDPmannose 4,6-dehydratase